MKKAILLYGLAVASGAFALQWLEFQHGVRVFSTDIYIALIALSFTALGVWVGHRLAGPRKQMSFERNAKAIDYLGISKRECEVLELLAEGHSNREIGKKLFVSDNTVKSHLSSLYGKLEVSRRTQAVQRARTLGVIA